MKAKRVFYSLNQRVFVVCIVQGDDEIAEFIGSVSIPRVMKLTSTLPRVVSHDPDEDMLVATALAARADVLCTRNRQLCFGRREF